GRLAAPVRAAAAEPGGQPPDRRGGVLADARARPARPAAAPGADGQPVQQHRPADAAEVVRQVGAGVTLTGAGPSGTRSGRPRRRPRWGRRAAAGRCGGEAPTAPAAPPAVAATRPVP